MPIPQELQGSALTAIAGFVGVMTGGWLSARNQKRERRQKRISEQMSGFYGPMLALRFQVLLKGELAQKITGKTDEAWQMLVKRAYEGNDESLKLDRMDQLMRERWPSFEKLLKYGNRQLAEDIIPAYRNMAELFKTQLHLAEPSTIALLPALLEFVEIWDRWMDASLPGEVLGLLNHSETTLSPLYDDFLENFTRMHRDLSERRWWWDWRRRPPIKVHGLLLTVNPFAGPPKAD